MLYIDFDISFPDRGVEGNSHLKETVLYFLRSQNPGTFDEETDKKRRRSKWNVFKLPEESSVLFPLNLVNRWGLWYLDINSETVFTFVCD